MLRLLFACIDRSHERTGSSKHSIITNIGVSDKEAGLKGSSTYTGRRVDAACALNVLVSRSADLIPETVVSMGAG